MKKKKYNKNKIKTDHIWQRLLCEMYYYFEFVFNIV